MAQQHSREVLLQRFHDKDLRALIQSTINVLSDRIGVDDNGLKLEPNGRDNRLVSFFKNIEDKTPLWNIAFEQPKNTAEQGEKYRGLTFYGAGKPVLFLQNNGNVGINTLQPNYQLAVNGIVSMKGRVGDFSSGQIPADGEWHNLLEDLEGCQAFEAFAHIIDNRSERYALTHATLLLSDKGGEKCRVISTSAGSKWLWGKWLNKVQLRWHKENKITADGEEVIKYNLQIRSRTRYGLAGGAPHHIFFRLLKLWDKNFENEGTAYEEPTVTRSALNIQPKQRTEPIATNFTPVNREPTNVSRPTSPPTPTPKPRIKPKITTKKNL